MVTKKTIPERQEWVNWKDVNPVDWPWKHFSPEEIACRGTGRLVVHKSAMDRLEALRIELGKPIILNSAYRSPEHNKAVGGEPNSYHVANRKYLDEDVMAFDCSMANHEPYHFQALAEKHGFKGIGHYPKKPDGSHNFMHIDNGPKRTWQSAMGRFPKPADKPADVPVRFDAEPAKPILAEIIKNQSVIATVGTAVSGTGIATAVQNPSHPLSWVFALAFLLIIGGIAWYGLNRFIWGRSTVTKGKGD